MDGWFASGRHRGSDRVRPGIALRVVVVAGAACLLASCGMVPTQFVSKKEYFSPAKYGKASPKVVASYRKVPKGGGHYVVGAPYRVAGKTYIPRDNPRYSAVGLASWYGAAFHGRLTANGEVYDVNALTAAHPTMPLPSYARVTNLENGSSVIVRVNDRGPFKEDRLIDVSATAADMLGFRKQGTAKVKVDYIGPARMDGLDQKMLVASYRGPGRAPAPDAARFAAAKEIARVKLASALSRPRPVDANAGPMQLMPAYAASTDGDGLGALILRSGLSQSYAETPRVPAAQTAAADLASHDLTTSLTAAAERKARQLTVRSATVVQIGTFSDSANAQRVAANFRRFGRTDAVAGNTGGRALQTVMVTLDAGVSPETVIAAANSFGLRGAFVLSR